MQHKLHTTPCHPELVEGSLKRRAISTPLRYGQHNKQPCHPERSEGSHNPTNHVTSSSNAYREVIKSNVLTSLRVTKCIEKSKFPNFQIFLFSIFYFLFSVPSYAQTYQWDWAVSGGGVSGDTRNEEIYDVKVGTDNNYYFIAPLYDNSGHQLNGQSLPTYNYPGKYSHDILLFSTTCDGTVRWSYVLGGGDQDRAFNLVLDSQNNVYIGAMMGHGETINSTNYPVHFSPTDSIPITPAIVPSDYWKTGFLVKFSSTGQYLGKKALQGDIISPFKSASQILDLAISNDTLHFVVGLMQGTHLSNNVTVPNTISAYQYYLVKYDKSLNYVSSVLLPIPDGSGFNPKTTRFMYDEALNRYYFAGMRSVNVTAALIPLTYGGKAFVERDFVLAIDGTNGNELWRREFYTIPSPGANHAASSLTFLSVDANSDVYVTCRINRSYNDNSFKIYDPNDQANTTYNVVMTPLVWTNLPYVTKFNSNGVVQWVKIPSAFANGMQSNNAPAPKGLAINGNEVAFGSSEANFEWDGLYYPTSSPFHRGDPAIVRLNKQTGKVIGLHVIPAGGDYDGMTAVAVDRDGNYITGGFFYGGSLFPNTPGITPLNSTGQSDFFVAKLANSPCSLSAKRFNKLQVNVYPNPTTGIVNIETAETLSSYRVYDIQGRSVQNGLFGNDNQVNLQSVATGTYFIKVTTLQGSTATVKVVKE